METTETTEVKPGWKTTEFYVSLATGLFGILVTLGIFTPDQAADLIKSVGTIAGSVITGIAATGYAVARGLAKK